MIKITEIYHDANGMQHTHKRAGCNEVSVPVTESALLFMADNYMDINRDGINHVVYDRDKRRIVQASGYSPERGMFCETY